MNLVLAASAVWVTAVGIVFFLALSLSLILIVLIQRPQGGGLGGAFGGGAAGSGQTAFGAKTGDVLTWATITIFVTFLVTASLLNFAVRPPEAAAPTLTSGIPADTASTVIPVAPPAGAETPPAQNPAGSAPQTAPSGTPAQTPTESTPTAEPSTPPTQGGGTSDPGSGG